MSLDILANGLAKAANPQFRTSRFRQLATYTVGDHVVLRAARGTFRLSPCWPFHCHLGLQPRYEVRRVSGWPVTKLPHATAKSPGVTPSTAARRAGAGLPKKRRKATTARSAPSGFRPSLKTNRRNVAGSSAASWVRRRDHRRRSGRSHGGLDRARPDGRGHRWRTVTRRTGCAGLRGTGPMCPMSAY